MNLRLEITSERLAGKNGQTVDEAGASLGRHSKNSWVLPHAKVSAHHAVITWHNGVFYIQDQNTTNGTFVSSPNAGGSWHRIDPGREYPLASGDCLLIGPYEISVRVTGDQRRGQPGAGKRPDPFEADDPFRSQPSEGSIGFLPGEPYPFSDEVRPKPAARDLERASLLDENFRPPSAVPDPAMPARVEISNDVQAIPENYDPLADVFRKPAPPLSPSRAPNPAAFSIPADYDPLADQAAAPSLPPPRVVSRAPEQKTVDNQRPNVVASAPAPVFVEPARNPSAEHSAGISDVAPVESPEVVDLATVLSGAGLDSVRVDSEMARDLGQILRVVVAGVMDGLRSRQEIKDEFRMRTTRFKPATENNPLKFSEDVNQALHNLLVKRNPAYLPAVDAFEDAFVDLRSHQIAMLAGIRVAFESLLAEFEPDRMQEEFDRQLNKGLVPVKHRYWDLYREKVEKILKDRETTYRRLFGEAFVRAYEDQVRAFRDQKRAPASDPKTPSKV